MPRGKPRAYHAFRESTKTKRPRVPVSSAQSTTSLKTLLATSADYVRKDDPRSNKEVLSAVHAARALSLLWLLILMCLRVLHACLDLWHRPEIQNAPSAAQDYTNRCPGRRHATRAKQARGARRQAQVDPQRAYTATPAITLLRGAHLIGAPAIPVLPENRTMLPGQIAALCAWIARMDGRRPQECGRVIRVVRGTIKISQAKRLACRACLEDIRMKKIAVFASCARSITLLMRP